MATVTQHAGTQNGREPGAPRCAAIVGPYLSGKSALLESLLFVTGATHRKGTAKEGNTIADSSAEARARKMSVEVTAATTDFLGERWCFLDCPGSVELAQEARNALMVADVAIVVCEPVIEKALMLAPTLKFLDDHQIPHILFINKMDVSTYRVREMLDALQAVSSRPLVLRQVPIRGAGKDGGEVTGYVDLVSERAYKYHPGQESDLIQMPEEILPREQEARGRMLESLADFDDHLMEEILSDVVPPKDEIYQQFAKDLASDLIVPVLLGEAERDGGVRRLLKALRHEVPGPEALAQRLGISSYDASTLVFKTYHQPHAGKLSLARIFGGRVSEGSVLNGARVAGVLRPKGNAFEKVPHANTGEVVALARMEEVHTGDLLTASGKKNPDFAWPAPLEPLFVLAMDAENRADEVKLTTALAKLTEEDTSLTFTHDPDTHELLLSGQGEIHLHIAFDRLKSRFSLPMKHRRPQVSYKETIRSGVKQHARFKRQSGGHGQFADIHIEVWPLARGAGFEFHDRVVGGSVPRQFIGSVEEGARESLSRGPLGFPVVDVAVALFDGQFHAVDSSDMAFKTVARQAMQEALPQCGPILLEPIFSVEVSAPAEFTARVHNLVTGRRGQILSFQAKEDWTGWEVVQALVPQSELHDMIIELRSLTLGIGNFSYQFDHLQELSGRLADKVIEQRQAVPHKGAA
ncbi:MAG: elongation factor G [Rhodospirillaceae bacterium]|nr:elongation factor G [Rhodospirillaceae bacterium]